MRVAVVLDERCEGHAPGGDHPEGPDRLRALRPLVEGPSRVSGVRRVPGRLAMTRDLQRVHSDGYVRRIAALSRRRRGARIDADTSVSAGSFRAARAAAGAGLALLDAVVSGSADAGFALVRPPGHHAERDGAAGFCLFNNVALLAAYAMSVHAMPRVMIVDWDVHHGGATQRLFEDEPDVLYLSMHSAQLWPGTGSVLERGVDLGRWTTVNLPLEAERGDADYLAIFERIVRPAALAFRPSCVIVSAGFDAHAADPLGDMCVTTEGFGALGAHVGRMARELGGVPLILALEGGYDERALAASVRAVLEALRDDRDPPSGTVPSPPVADRIEFVRELHGDFARLARIGTWGPL